MTLDVGTNNQRLLDDPLYLGWRHPRLEGDEDLGVHREVRPRREAEVPRRARAVGGLRQAQGILAELERYRDRVLSFDDDIQGTGAVAASVLMTAMRIKKSRLADQRIGIVGMGQAGIGIATNVLALLKAEGLSDAEARRCIYTGDTPGLLCEDTPGLSKWQRPFARDRAEIADWTLASSDRVNLMDTVETRS